MPAILFSLTLASLILTGMGLYDWHLMRNYREVHFKRRRKA